MNNFNTVFIIVKNCCEKGYTAPECFEKIAEELRHHRQMNAPQQYLDALQDLGLIKYSTNSKSIALTDKGKRTDTLFSH